MVIKPAPKQIPKITQAPVKKAPAPVKNAPKSVPKKSAPKNQKHAEIQQGVDVEEEKHH